MKPQNTPTPESEKAMHASPGKLVCYMGWLVVFSLALMLLWIGSLYLTVQTEKVVLLQQQELTNITLSSMRNQLEAERILSAHQLMNANQEIQSLKQKLQE